MLKLKSETAKKGYRIYETLKPKLEKKHPGKFVAIELDSHDYFIGNDMNQALDKAEQRYPDKEFFVVQVGELATASFKHRFTI